MHCNILLVVSFSLLFSFKETTRRICAHFTRLLIKCPHLQKYTSGQFLTKSHIITTLHASLFCPYLHLQQLLSRIFNGLKTGLAPIRTHRPLNFTLNPLILGLVHNDKILSATNPLSGRGWVLALLPVSHAIRLPSTIAHHHWSLMDPFLFAQQHWSHVVFTIIRTYVHN